VVLAAGASRRMGSPKALLAFGATTALGRVVDACRAAGLGRPLVVVGAHADRVGPAAAALGARVVGNPRWAEGRTTSIQAGIAALPADAAAALLWPVDVCLPDRAVVEALLRARAAAPAAQVWVPCHGGRRGHPVLIARAATASLAALGPDEPARQVIRGLAARGAVAHVEVEGDAVLRDMNTPQEYRALRALVEPGEPTG